MTFEYRDAYGRQFRAEPGLDDNDNPLAVLWSRGEFGASVPVRVPADRVEEVVAGVRDAARQAAGQPADDECVCDERPEECTAIGEQPIADPTVADDPVRLRWGLNDVLYGDDDTTIVCMSGPDREPYWLELDRERAAVLRHDLAGPEPEPQDHPGAELYAQLRKAGLDHDTTNQLIYAHARMAVRQHQALTNDEPTAVGQQDATQPTTDEAEARRRVQAPRVFRLSGSSHRAPRRVPGRDPQPRRRGRRSRRDQLDPRLRRAHEGDAASGGPPPPSRRRDPGDDRRGRGPAPPHRRRTTLLRPTRLPPDHRQGTAHRHERRRRGRVVTWPAWLLTLWTAAQPGGAILWHLLARRQKGSTR